MIGPLSGTPIISKDYNQLGACKWGPCRLGTTVQPEVGLLRRRH